MRCLACDLMTLRPYHWWDWLIWILGDGGNRQDRVEIENGQNETEGVMFIDFTQHAPWTAVNIVNWQVTDRSEEYIDTNTHTYTHAFIRMSLSTRTHTHILHACRHIRTNTGDLWDWRFFSGCCCAWEHRTHTHKKQQNSEYDLRASADEDHTEMWVTDWFAVCTLKAV